MNPNAKTPVMVLQEFTVKKGYVSPEYSVILARQGTHDNEFHYQVSIAGICAIGVGRSKQVAKHNAATKALEILADKGLYTPDSTPIQAPRYEQADCSPSRQLLIINAIGNLGEVCSENKLPFPMFKQISDVGPPHCKEFTYQCQIASITTRATSGTKKQAKQLAAKDMLERMMLVLPELVAECSEHPVNQAALTDQDTSALENYIQLKEFKRPRPNLAVQIQDYDKNICSIMQELSIGILDIQKYFQGDKLEDDLKELLDKLQLDYLFESLNESPIKVTLTLNTDVPFTVIGTAKSIEGAKLEAVLQAFEFLEIFAN